MYPNFPSIAETDETLEYVSNALPTPPIPNGIDIYSVSLGPEILSNSTNGITEKKWLVYQEGSNVKIRPSNVDNTGWDTPVDVFTEIENITHLSLAFDQSGREVIAYNANDTIYLWYYDSLAANFIKRDFGLGLTPVVGMDYVFDLSNPDSDILFYYVKNDVVYIRVQRERYDNEYNTGLSRPSITLLDSGYTANHRFQIKCTYRQ